MTATLASHGATLIGNGYPIVPICPGTKSPKGVLGWQKIKADQSTLDKWISEGRGDWGIGILGDETPAIDFDISDEDVLKKAVDWCHTNIGVDNSRIGRAPRTLSTYRADVPFGKMSSAKFEAPDGSTHQIEILGKGNQYVAYAVHPDTNKPYTWSGLDPLVMPAELLPTLTPEKAKALIEYFESIVPSSWKPVSKSSAPAAHEHEGNPVKVAQLHRLRSAVDSIPNKDLPYDEWIRVMYGLWAAVGENKYEGFEIFDDWSTKSSKYNFEETLRVWEAVNEVRHIGAGTLFHLAKENGWVEPIEDMTAWMEVVEGIEDEKPSADNLDMPAEAEPGSKKPDRFWFETTADLRRLPPAKWLVKNWIPDNTVGLIYGKWASGKSFMAFDLALHLAYGMPSWHGADLPATPCKVLVIAREGHQGFVSRIDAFKKHHGIVDDTTNLVFMRAPVNFMSDPDFKLLEKTLRDRKDGFRLTIIDTVARVIPGVDMSAPETVTAFTERCSRISNVTGSTTVGVHHQNKSGGMMGSIYFEANADFVFEMIRDGENGPLERGSIRCTKMKDGPDGWSRAISYKNISWGEEPDPQGSLVVDRISETDQRRVKLSAPQKRALAALEETIGDHGFNIVQESLPLEARIVPVEKWREVCVEHKLSKADTPDAHRVAFNRAKKELIELGIVGEHAGYVWNQEDEK